MTLHVSLPGICQASSMWESSQAEDLYFLHSLYHQSYSRVCSCTDTSTEWICINACHTPRVTRTNPAFFCQHKEHFVASHLSTGKQCWLFETGWDGCLTLQLLQQGQCQSGMLLGHWKHLIWEIHRKVVWHLGHKSSDSFLLWVCWTMTFLNFQNPWFISECNCGTDSNFPLWWM